LSASFAAETCARGEKALYFSFEESVDQTVRNMRSIGTDFQTWIDGGTLRYVAARPTFYSLEMHLAVMLREISRFAPSLVILDPISAFMGNGDPLEVQSMLLRMVDFLKSRGVTGVFTHLAHSQEGSTETDAGLSSLMDAWILLLNREVGGEFNRELYLLKARGTAHSNQVREFVMSDNGIELIPPYIGDGRALTGSQRKAEEARLRRLDVDRKAAVVRKAAQLSEKRRRALAQIEALQAELEADEVEMQLNADAEAAFVKQAASDKADMEKSRRTAD